MGVVIGLLAGAGLACIWWSWWAPAPERGERSSVGRTRDLLIQAGVASVTPSALAAASAALGIVTALVVWVVSLSPPIALCFGAMATALPRAAVQARARSRRVALRHLWPDVVDNLSSGVRAGLSLPESISQLGERGPEELRPQFRAFGEDYRATGRFSECLDALKDRLADPVGDRIVEALRMTRDVGGSDLGGLLRTLSTFLRDDARTRGELEARQSWTVNGARLAVAAPWVVLALLAMRPEAAQAYNSMAGVVVLVGGAVSCAVAYRVMVRIGRLPEDQRVLR